MIDTVSFKETSLMNIKSFLFSLLIITCSLLIAACDLFTGPKVDVFQLISDEVDYAAAPWVPLRIETNGLGITSPPPQTHDKLVKLGYSFKLSIVPDSDYPFRGWEAWVEGQGIRSIWKNDLGEQNSAHHPERVRFEPLNANGTEVEVFVYEMPPDGKRLIIGPWGANNEKANLRILTSTAWGTSNPPPGDIDDKKLGFPFTVEFTVASDWAFQGWKAYSYSGTVDGWSQENPGTLFSLTDVDIKDLKGGKAEVTVYTSEPVTLVPYCARRPYVKTHNLPNHFDDRRVTNYPIKIWFSNKIDEKCLNFENFEIVMQTNYGRGGGTPLKNVSDYYEDPIMEDGIVTIKRKKENVLSSPEFINLNITIKLDMGSIYDEGNIYMGEPGQYMELYYGVSNMSYLQAPATVNLEAVTGMGEMFAEYNGDIPVRDTQYYVTQENGERVVYLLFDKEELDNSINPTFTQMEKMRITEMNESVNYPRGEDDYPPAHPEKFTAEAGDYYARLAEKYKEKHSGKEPYIVRHVLKTTGDGIIQLAVQPTDTLGNYERFDLAKKVRVRLDTTPPNQVTTSARVIFDVGTGKITFTWDNPDDEDFDKVLFSFSDGSGEIDLGSGINTHSVFTSPPQNYHLITVDFIGNRSTPVMVTNDIIVTNAGEWESAVSLINTAGANKIHNIKVIESFSISGKTANTFTPSGITVNISGDNSNRTISLSSNGSLLRIGSGQTVTMANLTLQGRPGNNNSLVYVDSSGAFNMNSGTVKGNTRTGYGGGVYVNRGTFTMSGTAEISGNTASENGGGVYIYAGTFNMNGGTISGNRASSGDGGGVSVDNGGTFTMGGGTIGGTNSASKNTATDGGGVYINSGSTFTMSGTAEISGNTATDSGGGGVFVYSSGSTFIMNNGRISSNTAVKIGGGLWILNSATFIMNGGTIFDNIASSNASYGGGVNIDNGASFTMNSGTISRNEADTGGGICLQSGSSSTTMTMTGGEISSNTAKYGGGVCLLENSYFNMKGGVICSNMATTGGNGGGVTSQRSTAFIRIETGTVYGSNANDTTLRNTAPSGAALSGTAQRGTFNGTTWNSLGSLSDTNTTIIVVNGVLQP